MGWAGNRTGDRRASRRAERDVAAVVPCAKGARAAGKGAEAC
jgi:hypothetical protein